MEELLTELRKSRQEKSSIIRGKIPIVKHQHNDSLIISIFIFVFSSILFTFIAGFTAGLICSVPLVLLFIFWPYVVILKMTYTTGKKPNEKILDQFNERYDWLKKKIIENGLVEIDTLEEKSDKPIIIQPQKETGFSLWLGKSTGLLSTLWHKAGMAANQQVTLTLEDACQNVLVLGGIGSGKTTCVMQPLLLQCLDQHCGGLIFDIKGDVKEAVNKFAAATNRELVILGPHHKQMNLIQGLTPEVAASFLKSAFLLGNKGNVDSFWVDTASELCRNTLGMLSFLPNRYDLQHLHQYLFELDSQEAINNEIDALLPALPEKEARLLKTYCNYHDLIFSHFDAKIKSGVNATIAQALAPFNHPDLLDAFCSSHSGPAKMEDILNGCVCTLLICRFLSGG